MPHGRVGGLVRTLGISKARRPGVASEMSIEREAPTGELCAVEDSAYDQSDWCRDEGPGDGANPFGHPLIESGTLLHCPDVKGLLCIPMDVLPREVTQEVANSFQVLGRGLGCWWEGGVRCILKDHSKPTNAFCMTITIRNAGPSCVEL